MSCPAEACDQITLFDLQPNGAMKDAYYWSEGDNGPEWEDGNYDPIPDKTFKCGTAFWLQCDTKGNVLVSSGEVNKEDVETELNSGDNGSITLVGNTSPVPVYIQDILCPATHTDQITLFKLNPNGSMKEAFYWSEDGEPEWEDGNYDRADVSFGPGETFWIQCDVPGATITFPGVELK